MERIKMAISGVTEQNSNKHTTEGNDCNNYIEDIKLSESNNVSMYSLKQNNANQAITEASTNGSYTSTSNDEESVNSTIYESDYLEKTVSTASVSVLSPLINSCAYKTTPDTLSFASSVTTNPTPSGNNLNEKEKLLNFSGFGLPKFNPSKTKIEKMGNENENQESTKGQKQLNPRGKWASNLEFMLACFGGCIGLGNVWRFPYLAYKNGGGAFLVPYFLCVLMAGAPAVFLEISLGQYTQQGGISAWNISPIMKGVGFGTTVVVFLLNIYYIVILAWGLLYLCYSVYYSMFQTDNVLPWGDCGNEWNSENCIVTWKKNLSLAGNSTGKNPAGVDSVTEFWNHKVLKISSGIEDAGGFNWEMTASLAAVWIICYFCVFKGVGWTGKVVYFTALFPYVLMIILIIRGVTLEGAWDGIYFYLYPRLNKLGEAQVWIDAGTQIFFSYATSLGALTALGSYNDFHENCYRNSLLLCVANSVTSLIAGVAVFSVLGFMANVQGTDVASVAEKGPGLVFITYPTAILNMDLSNFWAILFFFMIIILGLDSQFIEMEGLTTAIVDLAPRFFLKGIRRELFILSICVFSFVVGTSMTTFGGMYVFQLFDNYAASGFALLWFCIFECVAIGWVYGADRYYSNIKLMVGYNINPWMKWAWRTTAIIFCSFVFIFSLIKHKPLTYNQTYHYPWWAEVIGWILACSSMVCVPLYAIFALLRGLYTKRYGESFWDVWDRLAHPPYQPKLTTSASTVAMASSQGTQATIISEYDGYSNKNEYNGKSV